ncbi:MAG: hypothetical protein MJ072_00210 [Clostridia bacterium]|nr:hypothetical protein [Clostridia bacterium]
MNYVLLVAVVVVLFAESIAQKEFNKRFDGVEKSNYLYNVVMTFFAWLCFLIVFLTDPVVNVGSLWYSLGFAVTFCTAVVFMLLAIRTGPLALTGLIVSFSLLIPTFYGIIFCGESLPVYGVIGLILLIASLLLVNEYKKEDNKITKKYLLFLILTFLGNGLCSTFQKMHQTQFDGQFGGFFMLAAMSGVFVYNLITFIVERPRTEKRLYTTGVALSGVTGVCNGLVNYFMVLLTTSVPAIILYPTVSAGSTLLLFFASLFVYKEKFKPYQYVGYAVGILAIVFLNI